MPGGLRRFGQKVFSLDGALEGGGDAKNQRADENSQSHRRPACHNHLPIDISVPFEYLARAKLHQTPVTTETSRGCRTPDDKIGL